MVKMSLGYTVIQKTNEFSNDFEKTGCLNQALAVLAWVLKKKKKRKRKGRN